MSVRLSLALDAAALPDGPVAVFRPSSDMDLSELTDCRVITGFKPDHDLWAQRGFDVALEPTGAFVASIVAVPRAKPLARALIAQAVALGGPVIVDGQKTDGIDSLLRAARKLGAVSEPVSKSHGKAFCITSGDFSEWAMPALTQIADGWTTAPGVFSADAPDPGSTLLAAALPPLKGSVIDLGAGWGYLSAAVLKASEPRSVTLVEAEHNALEAARGNIDDARAEFVWADALSFRTEAADHVICNPPFHTGRSADPGLGQAFIRAAARLLKRNGTLWLVANRHLPYEPVLAECFADLRDLGSDTRYKLTCARKPRASK